jgi:hypothetical protein
MIFTCTDACCAINLMNGCVLDVIAQLTNVIPTKSTEELLARMLSTVDDLCADRDQLVREQRIKDFGNKAINRPSERRFR